MADERASDQPDSGQSGQSETAVSQPHDKYFQQVFSNAQDAASLLRTCVPRPLADTLKWYRVKGFEEVTKHVEYVLATQPAAHRKLFSEALRRNVPGRGGEVMNYVEEMIERGRQEGRQEGELKGQVRAIEGFVARDIPWSTIEAATGIDEATFRRLRQQIHNADDNGAAPST